MGWGYNGTEAQWLTPAGPHIYPFIHLFIHPSVPSSAHLSICSFSLHFSFNRPPPICSSSTCLSIYPPIRLSIYPSIVLQLTNPPIHLTYSYIHTSFSLSLLAPEKQHQWNITRHGPQDVGEKCTHPGRSSQPIVLNLMVQYDPSVSPSLCPPGLRPS